MNRKVLHAVIVLFILVNLYFYSQSSAFVGTQKPKPVNPATNEENKNNITIHQNNNNENQNNEEKNEDQVGTLSPSTPLKTNYKLCIGVHSARSYYKKRASIRNSWLIVAKTMKEVLVRFTVGDQGISYEHPMIAPNLQKEINKFGDIALLPMVDTYKNLTRKTATWFWWTAQMHAQGQFSCEYVMKTDDDTWVNVEAIVERLKDKPKQKMAYGHWRGPERVWRYGKWAELDWPYERYPLFPHPAGYIVSSDLAAFLGNAFMEGWLKPYANEDATMGIWLTMVEHEKFPEMFFEGNECYDEILTLYGLWPSEIERMSKSYAKCGRPCGCDIPIFSMLTSSVDHNTTSMVVMILVFFNLIVINTI